MVIWLTFRHQDLRITALLRVAVLDGGYPAWQAEGLPIDNEPVEDEPVDAAAQAAASPPASTSYPAKLQVATFFSMSCIYACMQPQCECQRYDRDHWKTTRAKTACKEDVLVHVIDAGLEQVDLQCVLYRRG